MACNESCGGALLLPLAGLGWCRRLNRRQVLAGVGRLSRRRSPRATDPAVPDPMAARAVLELGWGQSVATVENGGEVAASG